MKVKLFLFIAFLSGAVSCSTHKSLYSYESETLKVEKLTKNTFVHTSYLQTDDFGKVPCNGMIVVDKGEALIIETPTNDDDAKELLDWVENTLHCKIVGVVVDHFHADCLGGLSEFHSRNIPSYAHSLTLEFAKRDSVTIPQNGFENSLELHVGNKIVVNQFLGEGHTEDNIVNYVPSDHVLFGGCLIKTMNASKGYLGDANVAAWSNTVESVKLTYKDAKIVVPGHGDHGGLELLDYTIELFQPE